MVATSGQDNYERFLKNMTRDIHQALKTEIVKTVTGKGCNFVLVRMQWSKNEAAVAVHANPTEFSTAGVQRTDFLSMLGFRRGSCVFSSGTECYSQFVPEEFDTEAFAQSFEQAYQKVEEAERNLGSCGYVLPRPEGWGYFYGKPSHGEDRDFERGYGDGHTGANTKRMKAFEDETFMFAFTWIEIIHGKGWTIHYRPKHPPLSAEMDAVFRFLGVTRFRECPEFDFEECYFRFITFQQRDQFDPFGGNAQIAHNWFDAHKQRFAPGVEKLLAANALIEASGLKLLPIADPRTRHTEEIRKRVVRVATPTRPPAMNPTRSQLHFDVAISFAGTNRKDAEELANLVKDAGFSVFYDEFYPEILWGKDLTVFFDEVYRKQSRYCVMFISWDYIQRPWTIHERRSALARALDERGNEYILPIRVEDVDLPGLPPTVGYIALEKGMKAIAEVLIKKLRSNN